MMHRSSPKGFIDSDLEEAIELQTHKDARSRSADETHRMLPGSDVEPDEDAFQIYDRVMSDIGIGRFHYQLVAVMGWGNAIDAINLLTVSFIIPNLESEWNLSAYKKGTLSSCIFLGMLFGAAIFSAFADKYGRKPVLIITLIIEAVFSLLSALSTSVDQMIVFRFLSGVGVGGSYPVAFAYYSEFLPMESRGTYIVILASFWTVGNILTASIAWVILSWLNWRWFVASCIIPTVSCIIMVAFWASESPRYLLAKNRIEEASQVVRRIANICQSPKFSNFSFQCEPRVYREKTDVCSMLQVYGMLFDPSLRKTTFLILSIWVSICYGVYGILLWFPDFFAKKGFSSGSQYSSSFIVACASVPGYIASAYAVERLGRKITLIMSLLLSCMSVFLILYAETSAEAVVAASIFNGVSVGAWNVLDIISTECFPTVVRSAGFGLASIIGRIASIVALTTNSFFIDTNPFIPLFVTAVVFCFGAIATYYLPDDYNNRPLSDVLLD